MTEQKSYKETLNLPTTDFPMKASLAQREPEMLKRWETEGVYAQIRSSVTGKPKYILHDGPPYANGNIHIGHALNKILKDIIVRYKTLKGFDALYVPGWDCHGLPIEHACLKEMGKRKEEVERVAFRKQARAYAERFISTQRQDFKRLGIFGEWEKPYLTMNYSYQTAIAESFLTIYDKGFVEQRLKPVAWCIDCETALADAELEYEDKVDATVYVAFPVEIQGRVQESKMDLSLGFSFLVWTTTPWTLPANVGLAFNAELDYVKVETEKGCFVFARALQETLQKKMGWTQIRELEIKKGKDFLGLHAKHPFLDRESKVILADYVSATDGTGIVHIAPGHGEDDYKYGALENHLPILSPVNSRGKFTNEFPAGEGLKVLKEGNEKVIEILKEKGALLHEEKYSHSYPHCWRCKKPIIFRATPQWFMKVDHKDVRKKMSKAIQSEIQFTPDWGKNRIGSMVETRPDWCLSRQRYWGVPIPMLRCQSCQTYIPADRNKLRALFEAEGADAWFSRLAEEFLGDSQNCPKCGGKEFKKEEDILDVWFDSGVSHQAVLRDGSRVTPGKEKGCGEPSLGFPADLYLEGSDQHRGWFQSSLTASMAIEDASPFRGVLTHGFVMDGEGRKMSKSLGNVVVPQDVMKEFGADILRLWVSSCDYQFDVRISKNILSQLADSYRKIRNTFRYMLSNLYDFDASKQSLPPEKLFALDAWAIEKTKHVSALIEQDYEQFNFHQIYQRAFEFCNNDLSAYYFDILKDTLYTAKKDSAVRRSAQTAIYFILSELVKMLAPILPFTMDEIWRSYSMTTGEKTVHASLWQTAKADDKNKIWTDWNLIRNLRNAITPALEAKRASGLIGASLDAKIYLKADHPEIQKILKENWKELPRVFIVSQVEELEASRSGAEEILFNSGDIQAKLSIVVEKADGEKCVRCWNYSTVVGSDQEHPGLCGKCLEAVK